MTSSDSTADFSLVRGLFEELHLLNRVHNGEEFNAALAVIARWIKARGFRGRTRLIEIPAGAVHNHWRVPKRWKVHRFSVKDAAGREVLEDKSHPLTLAPFSDSFSGRLTREELLRHVHSREDLPEGIPFVFRKMYRHWEKGWALALPHKRVEALPAGPFDVEIVTEFQDKPMTMLEYTSPGKSADVVHLAAHLDHPGMCNDGLSGVIGALCAVRGLEAEFPRLGRTHSVLLCPEIVGSAVYLHTQPVKAKKILFALCANMLYHDAPFALCLSKSGTSALDKALQLTLLARKARHVTGPWHRYPDCGDEISYDAPGIGIPTSTLSRVGEQFPYYHTSLDAPELVHQGRFEEAVSVMTEALGVLERDAVPRRRFCGNPCLANPDVDLYLEPINVSNRLNKSARLDLRNLETGALINPRNFQEFVLSNLDGEASLLDLAFEARVPFEPLRAYLQKFCDKGLARWIPPPKGGGRVVKVALSSNEATPLKAAGSLPGERLPGRRRTAGGAGPNDRRH